MVANIIASNIFIKNWARCAQASKKKTTWTLYLENVKETFPAVSPSAFLRTHKYTEIISLKNVFSSKPDVVWQFPLSPTFLRTDLTQNLINKLKIQQTESGRDCFMILWRIFIPFHPWNVFALSVLTIENKRNSQNFLWSIKSC